MLGTFGLILYPISIFFIVIAIICLLPINVFAYNVNTSFDSDNCVLTVSGTQSGHDASVSLFNGNNLLGFKTGDAINATPFTL